MELMPEINLTGKAAENFDNQMDADRAFMEATDDCVIFRPYMDGEWDGIYEIGGEPPCLVLANPETGEIHPGPYNWICVVDVGRAIGFGDGEPSGLRQRFECVAPITPELREAIREAAIYTVKRNFELLRKQGKQKKGFGK